MHFNAMRHHGPAPNEKSTKPTIGAPHYFNALRANPPRLAMDSGYRHASAKCGGKSAISIGGFHIENRSP
ncbi:hypothetical protein [Ralstonia solanacearum]|uniref:hypothetical protein n=1 Tax=Ralstonia solanacearum TaxID=305 RepID=UPI0012FDA726|nr:hypothetical protein [Ralstonia solanacearum]